jgi:hypothetical protein
MLRVASKVTKTLIAEKFHGILNTLKQISTASAPRRGVNRTSLAFRSVR